MSIQKRKRILATLPKPTFAEFVAKTVGFELHPWQSDYLVPLLENLVKEKAQRILVHAPPQYGKSILVSKRFPAWALGMNPKLRIVLAGYNLEHAASFCEVVRDIMQGPDYKELFPRRKCLIPKGASRQAFSTQARARLKDGQESLTAVGLLSGFTGKGADILIIDDPYASPDDARSTAINERVWRWWNELAKVRINDETNVLVMFHRYHEDDFAGRLLAEGGWQYHRFPAIADENEDNSDPTVWSAKPLGFAIPEPPGDAEPEDPQSPLNHEEDEANFQDTPPEGAEGPFANFANLASLRETHRACAPTASQPDPNPRPEAQDPSSNEAAATPSVPPRLCVTTPVPANPKSKIKNPKFRRSPGDLLSPIRSRDFLKRLEDKDPMTWLGQFQGRPRAPEGAFIKREWLKEIAASEIPPLRQWVRFWDLATKADQKGDFVAGALLGIGPDQTVYLKDITRFRAEWPDARDIIAETTRQDALVCQEAGAEYEVGLEQVAWMRAMIQDLFTLPIFKTTRLTPVKPDGDKKERASGWVTRARNDMFRMVKGHWNQEFISECLAFDGQGLTHDDQVDSVSGAYALVWHTKGELAKQEIVPVEGSLAWLKLYRELNPRPWEGRDDWDGGWGFYGH